jgi:hypothetical protein
VGQGSDPEIIKVVVYGIIRAAGSIGINFAIGADIQGHRSSLDGVFVALKVDAPGLVPNQAAVFAVERNIAVYINKGRPFAIVSNNNLGVDVNHA